MTHLRKTWKLALTLALAVGVLQAGASVLVRTRKTHDRLELQLSRAFGRSVQVRHFNVQILPVPTLGAEAISIGEDPSFGNEYFLHADEMSAGLRWLGLFRGRLELGTISLSHPSLILVRNGDGRWNLERWLPPAKHSPSVYGPAAPPGPANTLRRIDFDEGRVNFKMVDDKAPFAFTNVSGTVEQISPGRWRLELEATPWRTGVALQSTGTLRVEGDVAGTSARLQPAELHVHWDNASLADVLRLWHGQDFGVRGSFGLDGNLKSANSSNSAGRQLSAWDFALHAWSGGLHRWDLGERSDNPGLSLRTEGKWFSDTRAIEAASFRLEAPQSSVRGEFTYGGHTGEGLALSTKSLTLQARDLLAVYRAFHAGVEDGVKADEFFSGRLAVHAWPPRLDSLQLESLGGSLQVPGIGTPVHIGPVHLAGDLRSLTLLPVVASWADKPPSGSAARVDAKHRTPSDAANSATVSSAIDWSSAGAIAVSGQAAEVADVLRIAQAFGHPLQRGWELSGAVSAALRWQWKGSSLRGRWNGSLSFSDARLQAAGLNFPVILGDARLSYTDGRRQAVLREAQAFGARWNGLVEEQPDAGLARWRFSLSADHLDAADLDRWAGPRARPNWLQRLLASMLGGAAAAEPSDLLRRVNAEGTVSVDEFAVGSVQLENVRAATRIHDLHLEIQNAEAHWAGGTLHGSLSAGFVQQPTYEFSAELERVNLNQLPGATAERMAGTVGGTIRLTTSGVGREALLEGLAGEGQLTMRNLEFRGWDLDASLADGSAHSGVSRWPAGRCAFQLADQSVLLRTLRLENGRDALLVSGKINLAPKLELALETNSAKRPKSTGAVRVLRISGPLEQPHVSIENASTSPAD